MRILIMGGTQFVSKALAVFLIEKGYKVSIFTRGKTPVSYSGLCHHYVGDRKISADLEQLRNENFDVVFDISAYALEDISCLLNCLALDTIKKYIYCSSGAVYLPSDTLADEEHEKGYNENWGDYGLNKLRIENHLLDLHQKNNFPVSIVRPSYIYGSGNNLYREAYLFERISQNKEIPIPARITQTQFIYIIDLLEIFESIMLNPATNGQAFNAVNSEVITFEDWVNTAANVLGKKAQIKEVDYFGKLKPRDFFPFRNFTYLLDNKKLSDCNLHVPQISLFDGMQLSYTWYQNNHPLNKDKKMSQIEEALQL